MDSSGRNSLTRTRFLSKSTLKSGSDYDELSGRDAVRRGGAEYTVYACIAERATVQMKHHSQSDRERAWTEATERSTSQEQRPLSATAVDRTLEDVARTIPRTISDKRFGYTRI